MKTLYMITQSPYKRFEGALPFKLADKEDAILLIQDGVLLCQSCPPCYKEAVANAKARGVKMYSCQEDIVARGVVSKCTNLNYDEIVDLIFAYERVV